jgi:hypothetical protein
MTEVYFVGKSVTPICKVSVYFESEEVLPGGVLDFNAENQVVGVEILNLSKRSPN